MKLTIDTYEVDENGTLTLAVLAPDTAPDLLADAGGHVLSDGEHGSILAWTWAAGMWPQDPRTAVRQHLEALMMPAAGPVELAPTGSDL